MNNTLAIVFGGGSGIGLEIVHHLEREQGVRSIIDPSRDWCDVRSVDRVNDLFWRASGERRMYDEAWIVYSAGVNYLEWIGQEDPQKQQEVVDVNLVGFFNVMSAAKRFLDQQVDRIRVIVVGSDAAWRPMRTSMAYCASKAGLEMAARVAARELGGDKWAVNVIAPGMTEGTGMTGYVDERVPIVRGWTEEFTKQYEQQQAVRQERITRSDIADLAIQVLQMPMSVNGATFTINGGRS